MKKIWTGILAAIIAVPLLQPPPAQAAKPISIYIDGSRLATKQAPLAINGRVMLPMRAIFEALGASINWNQKSQTVTAQKNGTTIKLKIKAKTATIDNKTVKLDVPAQNLRGTTMVPVRFVSEALGESVGYTNKTKIVTITTSGSGGSGGNGGGVGGGGSATAPNPVVNVYARDIGDNGDGRDLEVSFSKSYNESRVDHYRVLIVKSANVSRFSLAAAKNVSSGNYTSLYPTGSDPVVTLTSNSRDVDGEYIREDQSYVAFVLAVGKTSGQAALSNASPAITLQRDSVAAATNVIVSDIGNYGDGRDLRVEFTRAQRENHIANYRVFVVKTADAYKFDLKTANNISDSYSTVVNKSGSSQKLSVDLTSSSRDTSGEYIKNGVAYTVFVMSVSSNPNVNASKLSAASSSIKLDSGSLNSPVVTKVEDVNDYGDGRDLQVSFSKVNDESKIGSYRIFIVKSKNYSDFTLSKANNVSSNNYTQVSKTGYNISNYRLSSSARDVDGDWIRNDVNYRVFVMAVGSGSNANVLSSASSSITLVNGYSGGGNGSGNNGKVKIVSNLTATDVDDYGDGRDLRVEFSRASDESYIDQYRIMVVKSSKAGSFTLSKANDVSSRNYTRVYKDGKTLSEVLSSDARDVDGDLIKDGVSYKVFVLSVGKSGYSNALSYASSEITLKNGNRVGTVSNLTVSDVADNGDGRDLRVEFTRASDESYIDHYRIMVVKSKNAGSFTLPKANNVSSNNYTRVYKNGNTLTEVLGASARDVDGDLIREGVSYKVFVLSAGRGNYSGTNALSKESGEITLSKKANIGAVSNLTVSDVADNGNGSDLQVSFNRAADETNVSSYRIMVVKSSNAGSFDLSKANNVAEANYTYVSKNGNTLTKVLDANARDVNGEQIREGVSYKVFVLTAGGGNYLGTNALSNASGEITLSKQAKIEAVSNLTVSDVADNGNGSDLQVSFNRAADETNVSSYRIMVVKSPKVGSFNLSKANEVAEANYTYVSKNGNTLTKVLDANARDVDGEPIREGVSYNVFVLTAGGGSLSGTNALSNASGDITLSMQAQIEAVSNLTVSDVKDNGKDSALQVSFNRAADETNIGHYRIMAVKSSKAGSFNLSKANEVSNANYTSVDKNGNTLTKVLDANARDIDGETIREGVSYNVFVLSAGGGKFSGKNALSSASSAITLKTETKVAEAVTGLYADIIGNTNVVNDISVGFNKLSNESNIEEYRIMAVPQAQAATFNLASANNVTLADNYTQVKPNGSNVSLKLQKTKDAFGNAINTGTNYQLFVLTVTKAGSGYENALSAASNPFKLTTSLEDVTVPRVSQASVQSDATGISVSFTAPQNAEKIASYVILAVPSGGSIDLASAEASKDKGIAVPKAGPLTNIKLAQDFTGQAINTQSAYSIYILSVPDMTNAKKYNLSAPFAYPQVQAAQPAGAAQPTP
ncbi:copper amine oxidase N-terminal domain-containing protein [Paenibacillus oralis]|uniref:copper amine oxidase N-terminal domain-containing protein n=1 Tax=Paenibacillus oralis TaxID=2490856 RepID=UPI001FEA0709|nr:copper amine oxidase N-terminal domain-containing protein [Paenibacillus oralis]